MERVFNLKLETRDLKLFLILFPFERSKLFEQLLLPFVQLGGYFDRHLDVLVSLSVSAQMRNAHPAQGEDLAALGSGWDGDFFTSVQRGDLNFFSQCGLDKRNGDLAENIIFMPFEEGVRLNVQDDIKVSGPASPFALSPLSRNSKTTP